MFPNNYETVFILTPVLSDAQMKDAVDKFRKVLTDNGAELVHEENMGLRKLAYPIQHKNTGYYQLFEFKALGTIIEKLNTEYLRDERIIRHLTIALDKHAVAYNDRKRNGLVGKKNKPKTPDRSSIMSLQNESVSKTENRKKYDRFKKAGIKYIDYKDGNFLLKLLNEQGKILPRRLTGTSLKNQRKVAQAVKRARHLAILPFVGDSLK